MISLPAPLLRGLSVLAIGGALAIGHVTFASAAPKAMQVAVASVAAESDVTITSSIGSDEALGENCYVQVLPEWNVRGKTVIRRVHECD
jgi:hypothetical protein